MNMHKMDGTQTYHLAKEMIPVYTIAITQERCMMIEQENWMATMRI